MSRATSLLGSLFLWCMAGTVSATGQTVEPSPSPSASPRANSITVKVDAHSTFVSESTRGPGTVPPEGPVFAAGSPLSPLTPYDVFSSAPFTPGNAAESAIYVTPQYEGS